VTVGIDRFVLTAARQRPRNAPVPSTQQERSAHNAEASLPLYLAPSGAYSIRCESKTVCCAARTSWEITLLICGRAAATKAIMTYRSTLRVDHWPLLRLVDLLRC
jgi:hypothetical protein